MIARAHPAPDRVLTLRYGTVRPPFPNRPYFGARLVDDAQQLVAAGPLHTIALWLERHGYHPVPASQGIWSQP